jgi:O-methyltransferase domain
MFTAKRFQIERREFGIGDIYVLKWIIHDWNDQRAAAILKNCRSAMAKEGRVLIIESVIRSGTATSFSKFVELNILVMTGGRERTEAEYRALLDSAGLRLTRIIPTATEMSIIEGVQAGHSRQALPKLKRRGLVRRIQTSHANPESP